MSSPDSGNLWAHLDSDDFDTARAIAKLRAALVRPKFGRGKAISEWKSALDTDKTWCPDTYWCYNCDAGFYGRGIATVNGPNCEWCMAPVDERCDMRRLNGFAPNGGASAPHGSEFWSWDDWQAYDVYLEDYYDSITPDGD